MRTMIVTSRRLGLRPVQLTTATRALSTNNKMEHGVSYTALMTAAIRGMEVQEQKPLFYDPYASLLAGEEGVAFFQEMDAKIASSSPGSGIASKILTPEKLQVLTRCLVSIRHKYFDDFLLESLAKIRGGKAPDTAPLQFVNLAAGLDSRAYRMPWPGNLSIFEVDRAEVRIDNNNEH